MNEIPYYRSSGDKDAVKISGKDILGGYPTLAIRGLLRQSPEWLTLELASNALAIDESAAGTLFRALESEGYIVPLPQEQGYWRTTVKGNALTMASAGRPLRRAAADKLLREFLARVEQARDEPHWCFKVTRAVVFGSYLSDVPTLGDVDVAVEFRRAHSEQTVQHVLEERCRNEAEQAGRRFSTFADRLFWPDRQIRMFLKARSRLSLHDLKDDARIVEAGPHMTIYADERVCRGAVPSLEEWSDEISRCLRETAHTAKERRSAQREQGRLRKKKEELRGLSSQLERFGQMSREELQEHREEVDALLAHARRLGLF